MTRVLVVAAGALAAGVALTPLAMVLARRTGVVDRPGPLKPHAAPVPYLGGLAVLGAAVIGAALGRPSVVWPLAGALVLGVLDDRFDLSPALRLAGQVAVGAGVACVAPTVVPGVGGGVLVCAVAVVLMNGVNFLDGLDALAGGVALVAGAAFAALAPGAARDLATATAAGVAGFLLYNRPPARVYLGDGGAYLLGAILAVLLALEWSTAHRRAVSVAALTFVVLPAGEVVFAVVRRLRGRAGVTRGDRRHPYDLMVARGCSAGRAALAYAGAEVLLVVAGLWASTLHTLLGPALVAGAAAVAVTAAAGALGALSPGPEVPV